MTGEIVWEYFGIDEEGNLSTATAVWQEHGSWFSSMRDVNKRIEELKNIPETLDAFWVNETD